MIVRPLLAGLCTTLIVAACAVERDPGNEVSGTRAAELIVRNLLAGQDRFPVEEPRIYQYGNVHVDGPTGGMLYRFGSDVDALEWMVQEHRLLETRIEPSGQLPLDFLDDRPRWWDPWQANPTAYYSVAEQLVTGGKRQLIVIFDSASGLVHAVEHYADMPGI